MTQTKTLKSRKTIVRAFFYPISELLTGAALNWLWFDPDSKIGVRRVESPVMYVIVQENGWVRGEQIEPVDVTAEDDVFWDTGK